MRAKAFRGLVSELVRAGTPVPARCRHASECGGCAFQDRAYPDQLAAKREALARLFSEAGILSTEAAARLELVASPDPYGYRTRMDYVATRGRFGLRARGRFNHIVELAECHLIPPAAFAAAHAVWQAAQTLGLPDYNLRSHEGFLRYIVVRRNPDDELLLAVVTADGPYETAMEQLAATALEQPAVIGFHWLHNPTRTDLSSGTPVRHWGATTLPMRVGDAWLQIGPNSFFQNNLRLLDQLLADVRGAVVGAQTTSRVVDLYGGVGTIAISLAPHVGQVDCVEAVAESAALARQNAATNGAAHVSVICSEVLPYLRAQPAGACAVAVLDPPRTGLGPEVCHELLRLGPQRIAYVSCNPLTQVEDLHVLASSYRLCSLRGYDMFPHTPHVETLAVLERCVA